MSLQARALIAPLLLGSAAWLAACAPFEPAPDYPVYEGPVYYDQYGYPIAPPPGYYGYYGAGPGYYDYPSYYYTDPAYSGYFYFDNGVRRPYPDHRWHGSGRPPPPRDRGDGGNWRHEGDRDHWNGRDNGDRHHGDDRPPVSQPPQNRQPRDPGSSPQGPQRPFPNQGNRYNGGGNGGGPNPGSRPQQGPMPQAMPRPSPAPQAPATRPAPQPQQRDPGDVLRRRLER